MSAEKPPKRRVVRVKTAPVGDSKTKRSLTVVSAPKAPKASPSQRSIRVITDSSQLPVPEAVLSGAKVTEKESHRYVLGEQIAGLAIVFRTNAGNVWLLYSDSLPDRALIELASIKTDIRKNEPQRQFAVCSEILLQEFLLTAQEQHKQKLAFSASDQHLHFEQLVEDAVANGVSDIHITLVRGRVIVEYRIDSRNQEIRKFPWSKSVEQTTALVRSVYNTIAGGTNASWNSRVPQDASIIHPIKGKKYQLRYAHDNVEGDGFHLVLRVLDDLSDSDSDGTETSFVPLQKLGLYDDESEIVDRMMEAPFGFLCVSGTTGSGKSTFLKNTIGIYAYANPGKNILTVENPVEYRIFNAKQTSVAHSSEMGAHLISALRRDPDCILIGEIRDVQTAKVAVEATQTGHFVWSTLHASNAISQISRLEDIGISRLTLAAPEFIAGMIHLALARKVCSSCRVHIKDGYQTGLISNDRFLRVKQAVNGALENVYVANPKGCAKCSQLDVNDITKVNVNAGFKGRMSVPEMIVPNLKILHAIKQGDDLGAYEAWIGSGGITLQKAAVRRLKDGHLCANEVEKQFKRLDHASEFYV